MATIRDVAKEAHVSPATVSRILKGDTTLSVSPETRNKVLSTAERLNYIIQSPKPDASLGTIMVTNWYTKELSMTDLYFRSIRWGAETALKSAGYRVKHNFLNESLPEMSKIDGIIAIGGFLEKDVSKLKSLGKPLVVLNQNTLGWNTSCVVPDFGNSVDEVLNHLRMHSEKIGFIAGKSKNNHDVCDPRTKAYRIYMQEQKQLDPSLIFEGDFSIQSGYEQMMRAINQLGNNLPRSFFIASDTMAIGALKALHEKEISVPDRVEIIGFGNLDVGNYITPALSTVKIATRQIGQLGVILLKNIMNGNITIPTKMVTQNRLVVRDSSF